MTIDFKKYLCEAVDITNNEYYDVMFNEFGKEFDDESKFSQFKNLVNISDNYYSSLGDSKVMKTDGGGFIAKWTETEDTIMLHGIVAKNSKISKKDIGDIKIWIEKLANKIINGKALLTTPHIESEKMLKHLKNKIERRGYRYNIETIEQKNINGSDHPRLKFKTVKITAI